MSGEWRDNEGLDANETAFRVVREATGDDRGARRTTIAWYVVNRETGKPVPGPNRFGTEKAAQEHYRNALNGDESLEIREVEIP